MDLGFFLLGCAILFGIGAIYDELKAIRNALAPRPTREAPHE